MDFLPDCRSQIVNSVLSLTSATHPPVPLKVPVSPPFFTSCTLMSVAASIRTDTSQRLILLRKINSFSVSTEIMCIFYRGFTASVLTFCITAWFGNLNLPNRNRRASLVKMATLSLFYNRQVLRRAITRRSLYLSLIYITAQ